MFSTGTAPPPFLPCPPQLPPFLFNNFPLPISTSPPANFHFSSTYLHFPVLKNVLRQISTLCPCLIPHFHFSPFDFHFSSAQSTFPLPTYLLRISTSTFLYNCTSPPPPSISLLHSSTFSVQLHLSIALFHFSPPAPPLYWPVPILPLQLGFLTALFYFSPPAPILHYPVLLLPDSSISPLYSCISVLQLHLSTGVPLLFSSSTYLLHPSTVLLPPAPSLHYPLPLLSSGSISTAL